MEPQQDSDPIAPASDAAADADVGAHAVRDGSHLDRRPADEADVQAHTARIKWSPEPS